MSSLRVALVHNLSAGGAWRTMQEHDLHLQAETLEFCLQTAAPLTRDAQIVPFARRAERLSPALRPIPRHLDLLALVAAWRKLARAVNEAECDVVLAHPCRYLQAPLALRWVERPSLYFCHEPRRVNYEQRAAATVNPRTRLPYLALHRAERALDRSAVASADRLLTNSRFTARRIEDAYGRSADPIPLGVPRLFREAAPSASRTHLLSVGSLIASKGHDLAVLAAARTARRWPLVVVAPRSQPSEVARLEALAAQSSVALDLRIGVTDAELRELYRGAVATLYLASEEPFGLVSLEAQACGSPVVVADDGGLPETMIAGETGWVVAREDSAAAARAIDALEDSALMSAVSTRAREHGAMHTWERSTTHLEDALASVALR